MTMKGSIRRFIHRELLDGDVPPGDPLALGLVDSLAAEQLVAFLQETYGVTFADEELSAKNFESVDSVVALVKAKRSGRG